MRPLHTLICFIRNHQWMFVTIHINQEGTWEIWWCRRCHVRSLERVAIPL